VLPACWLETRIPSGHAWGRGKKQISLVIPCLARLLLLLGQAHVLPAAEMRRVLVQCSHADSASLRHHPAYFISALDTDVYKDDELYPHPTKT
jgi:hypothetical protein